MYKSKEAVNAVQQARTNGGHTQVETAVGSRVSLGTIRLAERGIITRRTAARLARFLGVEVDVLLGRKGGV